MNAMIQRFVAILAALLLAGAVVGCEREVTQMGDQEQPPTGEQQEEEEPAIGEPTAEQEQPPEAAEQEQAMQDLRDHVSDVVEMPASAVMFGEAMQTQIEQAQLEFKRESLATLAAVNYYTNQLDEQNLDSEEQSAVSTIGQHTEQARSILDQIESTEQANYDELKGQVDDHLDEVTSNWEIVSDKVEPMYEQQPAGGGPMEGQEQQDTLEQPSDSY